MAILFNSEKKDYGDRYDEHLFEQYKLYIGSIEKVSDRRQSANSHFITVNTALVSLIALISGIGLFDNYSWLKSILCIVGLVTCVVFWFLIRSYKQLNTGKFKLIHEIEEKLPLSLYKYEWEILGKGKDKNIYYPFSHIELIIPWIFGAVYLLVAFSFIFIKNPITLTNNKTGYPNHIIQSTQSIDTSCNRHLNGRYKY